MPYVEHDNDAKAAEVPCRSRDRCRDQQDRHEGLAKSTADLAKNVEPGGSATVLGP
jgi:hypothetical protein